MMPADWSSLPNLDLWSTILWLLQHAWPLFFAAVCAGLVDSIGGGGGLITVPALLAIGVPAPLLLGTNKCLSTFGSLPAVIRYARAGLLPALPGRQLLLYFVAAAVASALGAFFSQQPLILEHLHVLVPGLLFCVMGFMLKRWFWDERRRKRSSTLDRQDIEAAPSLSQKMRRPLGCSALMGVAFYDGLFGPGTGSFFLNVFEGLGLKTITANAITKIFNLASNIGALLWLSSQGRWIPALGCMAAGCYLGGNYIGAGMVLRRGQALIRILVLLATSLMLCKHLARYF